MKTSTGSAIWSSRGSTCEASSTSRRSSMEATIRPVTASKPMCSLRHERRLRVPCFSTSHSPGPPSFSPEPLSWGSTWRAMGISPAMVDPPPWLQSFLDRLAAEDLSAATRRGYRYDLLQFAAWCTALYGTPPKLARLTEHDVIAWRQHMIARRQVKATTINRRLEAVRRLLRWAEATGIVAANVAAGVRTIRLTGDRQPVGLTAVEVHGLLRVRH